MTNETFAHLTDEHLKASVRRASKLGRWLALTTIVFFTLAVWVDLRWAWMTFLSGVLAILMFVGAGSGVEELKERDPDFKWEGK